MKTIVWVRLELSGDGAVQHGADCIDRALDGGVVQEAVTGAFEAADVDVEITSATVETPVVSGQLATELDDAATLLNALLGAMPPALQKKWPSITARAKARVTSAHAAVRAARGGS